MNNQIVKQDQNPYNQFYKPSIAYIIGKIFFFLHLITCAIYVTIVIVQHRYIVTTTLTFVMVIIYGYMIAWVAIINILFVCCRKKGFAVWIFRIGVKLLITIYPILAICSYYFETYLFSKLLLWIGIYIFAFSICYIIYELAGFICFEKTNVNWIYRIDREELKSIKQLIKNKRKQFQNNQIEST